MVGNSTVSVTVFACGLFAARGWTALHYVKKSLEPNIAANSFVSSHDIFEYSYQYKMFIVLTLASFLVHANAIPVSFGPITPPSLARDILFGRQVNCECTGIVQRTLFDIVRGCLLTIAACVYRAIHQNIPDPNATWGQRMWIRIKITILALFAPEMMIWWAMKQWMAARVIRDRVNWEYPELKWTLTHGYFMQMGGFVRKDDGCVIFLDTLLDLLERRHTDINALRKISKKEIDDHSKGDFLSKALVTVQTTWFVCECITRWQQKLLLTELEVVTLAFAVLNMFTYGFWWYKPLDVLCPIQLDVHDTPIAQPTSQDQQDQDEATQHTDTVPAYLVMPQVRTVRKASRVRRVLSTISSGFRKVGNAFRDWGSEIADRIEDEGFLSALPLVIATPFNALVEWLEGLFEETNIRNATHVPIFYTGDLQRRQWRLVFYLCCFIGMIFGAIHFLSWDSQFSTHTESLLWKISSIVLVAEPLLLAVFQLLTHYQGNIPDTIMAFFAFFSSMIGPIAYVLARGCLLVLAGLNLKNLPPKAFETVSWTSYIPHL